MILKAGDMWTESKADAILFTANSTVRADGALVMGRGAALEAQKLFPGVNKKFGAAIEKLARPDFGDAYGVVWLPVDQERLKYLGAFQVKHHYRDDAELSLIRYATDCLMRDMQSDLPAPGLLCAVNFPGIGWGRLRREDVLPIISKLPDNVEVWEKP